MTGIQGIPNPNTIWNHDKGIRGGLEDSSSLGMREMSTITCAPFNRQEPKLFRMGSKEESRWCHSQTLPINREGQRTFTSGLKRKDPETAMEPLELGVFHRWQWQIRVEA